MHKRTFHCLLAFLILLLDILGTFASDDQSWQLRMVNKLRFNNSKNFMAIHHVLAAQMVDKLNNPADKPKPEAPFHFMESKWWELEFEQSELSYFYGLGQPNMLIKFGNDPDDGAAYCDIGIYPQDKLKAVEDEVPEHCKYGPVDYTGRTLDQDTQKWKPEGNATIAKPFCDMNDGSLVDIPYVRAKGIFNVPSKPPRCMRDFYLVAKRRHEYHLLKYCARGYFFQGKDYNDTARRNFRKDWILYLAEGKLKCNISGNAAKDQRSVAKGFRLELVQKFGANRKFMVHGIGKLKHPDMISRWEQRRQWNERDFNDPHQPRFKEADEQKGPATPLAFWNNWGDFKDTVKAGTDWLVKAGKQVLQHVVVPIVNMDYLKSAAHELGLDPLIQEIKTGIHEVIRTAMDRIPIVRQICEYIRDADYKTYEKAIKTGLAVGLKFVGMAIGEAVEECQNKLKEEGAAAEHLFDPLIKCPDLEAILCSYEDTDREGKFILGGVIGAAQLDAAWKEGMYKDKMFWNPQLYKDEYGSKMEDKYRICYHYYNVMQRLNEYEDEVAYYNLVKRWGRYDVELRVHHHCTPRGERETLKFDIALGPQQAPDGIHEETEVEIMLNYGLLTRSTGQILCEKTLENCTDTADMFEKMVQKKEEAKKKQKEAEAASNKTKPISSGSTQGDVKADPNVNPGGTVAGSSSGVNPGGDVGGSSEGKKK